MTTPDPIQWLRELEQEAKDCWPRMSVIKYEAAARNLLPVLLDVLEGEITGCWDGDTFSPEVSKALAAIRAEMERQA